MSISYQEFSFSVGTDENPNMDAGELWAALLEEREEFVLPESAYGGTGYIDGLKPEDLIGPLAVGTDRHGRPFIAVRVAITNKHGKTREGVECYFQRYTNDSDIWVSGGDIGLMVSNMTNRDFRFLVELLDKGEAMLTEPMYYGSDEMRVRKVKLI